jgi:hypothetical protein
MATTDDTGNNVCDALKAAIRVWSVSMVQTLTDALVSSELQRDCAISAIIARDCVLHRDGVAGSAGTDALCWDGACGDRVSACSVSVDALLPLCAYSDFVPRLPQSGCQFEL